MDDRELLIRIDRHLDRNNELIARNNEVILGLRHFAQDLVNRFERVTRSVETAMQEQAKASSDLADQARAHERALMSILDELKRLRPADGTT